MKSGADFPRQPPPFQLNSDLELQNTADDPLKFLTLWNLVSSPTLKDENSSWRSNREISDILFQIVIEMCSKVGRVVKSDVLAPPGLRGRCSVANVWTSGRRQRPWDKTAFIGRLRRKIQTVRFLRGRRGRMITAGSEVAPSNLSVPSEESDGIPVVCPVGRTACSVPFDAAAGPSAGSDGVV